MGDTDTIFTDGNYGEAYPKDSDLTTSSNGVPFLRGSNIQNGRLNLENANYITISKHNELTSGHLEEDDIVIAVRGSLGSIGYVEENNIGWNINSQLAIIRTNKNEIGGRYLIQILLSNSGRKMINSLVTGTALKQLPIKNLKNIQFSLPSLPEQEAIGTFFSTLDRHITLHQRKLDKLKSVKQAYLSEMFPAEGERVPKRRFPGFTDAWELRKLGEVAEIVMGQSPDSKNYTDNPLDNILVQGNADLRDGCVVPRVWTTQVTKTAEKGDLILSVRAPVGDVGRTNYNVVLGRGVAGIKGNEFIYHLLVKMKLFGYWTKLSTGSTFESINSDDIKNSTILFPSHPEQEAIGSFFSTLDQHITLHQRKS